MDANRLFRLTVAGWALLVSWPMQLWILGADFGLVNRILAVTQPVSVAATTLVVGLMAGPLIGLFVSLLTDSVIRLWKGGSIQFDMPEPLEASLFEKALSNLLPSAKDQLKAILQKVSDGRQSSPERDAWWARYRRRRELKQLWDEFVPYFNVLFHGQAPRSLIEYATRRWTIYFMYTNSICAIILGSLLALRTAGPFVRRDLSAERLIIEVAFWLLVWFPLRRRLSELRHDIGHVARLWLYEQRFVWRRPVKVDLDSTMAGYGNEQYLYMQGAYEYVVTGTLKNYDARPDLPKIKVPVLSTTGEFDEVGPKTVEAHAKLIPGARFVLYKDAGHVTSWDARDANVRDVREFLRSVDKR